jgi:hypothetical protein
MSDVVLAIGTRKGLFIARGRDGEWEVGPIRFSTSPVNAIAIDGGRGRIVAGVVNPFWGASLVRSDDLGETWTEPAQTAADAPIAFPEDTGAALEGIWQLRYSPAEPGVVYAGVEPHAVFRSSDDGSTFSLMRGLWDHPHRPQWTAGAGGKCLHTVLPHPTDPATVTVGISAGGVYQTSDGGRSWSARNIGLHWPYAPGDDGDPEFGQCVHKIDFHAGNPDRLFLQLHGGVYRSDDAAASWQRIDEGLPADFGFPIVVHPHRPETVYVLPLHADIDRTPAGHRYRVYRSDDAGSSWRPLSAGLPDEPCYSTVLRDAMCTDQSDPAGIYFGTRDGCVYASQDDGDTWAEIVRHLPDVTCVRAATVG